MVLYLCVAPLNEADDGFHDTQPRDCDAQEDNPLVVGLVLDHLDIWREVGTACRRSYLVEGVDSDCREEGAILENVFCHERLWWEAHLKESVNKKQHQADDEHGDDASVGLAAPHDLRDSEGQQDGWKRPSEDDQFENIDIRPSFTGFSQ